MKYLQLLFIAILISACSGTKRIVEKTPEKTPEIQEAIKDPIIEKIIVTEQESPEINYQSTEKEQIKDTILVAPFNHSDWNNLLQKYVSKNGNVNYKAFKTDRTQLTSYLIKLGNNLPNDTWKKEAKLAYWINAYNAMTIDLVLRHYPIASIKDIKNPWEQRYWKLGDKWYNLEEIEHQILREMNEPRIHFAIVCASYSCPKLQNEAFTASNLEEQLTVATKEFLSDSKRNYITENNLELSKIFQWFSKDFKQNGSLIDFLNKYNEVQISDNPKIKYKDYNWALND
jgi:hypothetical protein